MNNTFAKITLFVYSLLTGAVTSSNHVSELNFSQGEKLLSRYVKTNAPQYIPEECITLIWNYLLIGKPFYTTEEIDLQNCHATSLYPTCYNRIIVCKKGGYILKKYTIKSNQLKLSSSIILKSSDLHNAPIVSIFFCPPNNLVLNLDHKALYFLKLDEQLNFSDNYQGTLKKISSIHPLLHPQIKMLHWKNQFITFTKKYELNQQSPSKYDIQITSWDLTNYSSSTLDVIRLKEKKAIFNAKFRKSTLRLHYYYEHPFFTIASNQEAINDTPILITQNKHQLAYHQSIIRNTTYHQESCCIGQNFSQLGLSLPYGKLLIVKRIDSPHICIYDAALGLTYHQAFSFNQNEKDNQHNPGWIMPNRCMPISDNTFALFAHTVLPSCLHNGDDLYFIYFMQLERVLNPDDFIYVLEREYNLLLKKKNQQSPDFIQQFKEWKLKLGLKDIRTLLGKVDELLQNKECWQSIADASLTSIQEEALSKASKRKIKKVRCIGKLPIEHTHIQLYTGSYLIGHTNNQITCPDRTKIFPCRRFL